MKIVFFCPYFEFPSAGIVVLLRQAVILQSAGYEVHIVYSPELIGKNEVGQPVFRLFKPTCVDLHPNLTQHLHQIMNRLSLTNRLKTKTIDVCFVGQ